MTERSSPVVLLGGTGTIGRATLSALLATGRSVRLPVRDLERGKALVAGRAGIALTGTDVTSAANLPPLMAGADAVISCLASRTGAPKDARAIDRDAHLAAIDAARAAGVRQFVLLSAICVQKPRLAFQYAKLEAEAALRDSGLTWSIVRPTAYFKSLVGQVARVTAGKPYLTFGDGTGTAATPISDADLARFLVSCLTEPARQNRILPIGGPHPALTPREIGAHIFARLDRPEQFRSVSPKLLTAIAGGLDLAGIVSAKARSKAELARIGHYYATESMLLWTGMGYDAAATPAFGEDHFLDYLDAVIDGREMAERGDHAVF